MTPGSGLATPPAPAATPPTWRGDRLLDVASRAAALAVPLLVGLMLMVLVYQALPSFRTFGVRFLLDTSWERGRGVFGALPFVYGTVLTSLVAMLLAVPLGVGAALYLSEIASG